MNKELILILGGARAGKTTHAEELAYQLGGDDVLYVATAEARDEEMQTRIAKHRAARPAAWRTLETPSLLIADLDSSSALARVVVVDCLTLLASNALLRSGRLEDEQGEVASVQTEAESEAEVEAEVSALLAAYGRGRASWIVISNEVGLGLVPDSPLGRVYRDALGRANQRLAAVADHVLFLMAGLPLRLK